MNEIAKQHNDLIDLPLKRFNASEIDILNAICYKCQNSGTREITLEFDQIRQLSHYQAKDNKQFLKAIEETNKKLLQLNFKIGDDKEWVQFVLFPTFRVSEKNQTVTIEVHKKFAYLLNDFTGNYTTLELQQSASLKSSYAKAMYKKLRQFRSTGKWITTLEDFKEYFDIPQSYQQSDIDKRVIKPAIAEVLPFFEGLKYIKKYKKSPSGKGRPRVIGYEFTFQAETPQEQQKKLTQENIAELTDWEKTDRYCPRCRRPIFTKQMENENGTYWFFGHTDYKTGDCSFKTYDYSELLQEYELHKEEEKPLSKENEENKKKLSSLMSKFFK
jgi:plasmid replication initiation protein